MNKQMLFVFVFIFQKQGGSIFTIYFTYLNEFKRILRIDLSSQWT